MLIVLLKRLGVGAPVIGVVVALLLRLKRSRKGARNAQQSPGEPDAPQPSS